MSDQEWEREVPFADMFGTVATIRFMPPDEDSSAGTGHLSMRSGAAHINSMPNATAWRQIAAAALDVADAIEETR